MANKYQDILDAVRQNYASVVWTHKIQEKQADIYAKRYRILETINILVAAATSCGIITTIFIDGIVAKIITTILSFGTLAITAYFKSFDVKSMEQQHRQAANKFIGIRNRLLHVIAELHTGEETDKISKEYNSIVKELNEIYVSAPSTTDAAVRMAEQALKTKDEYTYTQEEIDHFLPPALRGGISK